MCELHQCAPRELKSKASRLNPIRLAVGANSHTVTNRNYEIAAARHSGERLSSLADRYGLHVNSVSRIVQENAILVTRRNNRRLPPGLTVRAAIAIEDTIGIWPSEKSRRQIAERFPDFMKSHIRRAILSEVRDWLRPPSR